MTPRGFPGPLPAGETLLWQGTPDWRVLSRTALHTRGLVLYFAALAGIAGVTASVETALKVAAVGAVPVALAMVYAWAVARCAVYSITNRRVVLHIGLALPVTLNLPFARIVSADLRANASGGGDLSLTLGEGSRFAYVVLWPHARPWRFAPAQPTMRGLADAARPAQILARALAASAESAIPAWREDTVRPAHAPLAA